MPTYQYACTECGHAFDQVQSFTDDTLTECPQCSGRLRKIFNAVGVVFKGSGFYRNDSRSTTSSSDAAATPKSDTSTSGSSSSETTSTPAPTKKSESASSTPAASTASGSK